MSTTKSSEWLAEHLLGAADFEVDHWIEYPGGSYRPIDLPTTGDGFLLIVTAMRERHLYAEIEVEPDRYRVSYYKPYFAGPVHWGLVGQAEHERLPEANAEAARAALEREGSTEQEESK